MTGRTDRELRNLKDIRWEVLDNAETPSDEKGEEIFEIFKTGIIPPDEDENEYPLDLIRELAQELAQFLQELVLLLQIEGEIKVEIKDSLYGNAAMGKGLRQEYFTLSLRREYLREIINSLDDARGNLVLKAKYPSMYKDDSLARRALEEASREVVDFFISIGHELFHARTEEQDPHMSSQNQFSTSLTKQAKYDPDIAKVLQENPELGYAYSQGEKSAEAFGIRSMKEKIKRLKSKEQRSLIQGIFLIGERALEERTATLAQRKLPRKE